MGLSVQVSGCCERDIDLLLLEEFVSASGFFQWFLQSIGWREALGGQVIGAQRSATVSNGESDLEITLERPDGSLYRLLIENKVSASLQHRQAERYRERGESYVRHGQCQGFRTVIVAPETYLGEQGATKGFDAAVSYEAIRDWFNQSGLAQPRLDYKVYMLSGAIERSARGWQLIEDEPVTRFWRRYWQLAWEMAPELQMPEPTGKPSGSSFVRFQPLGLPSGVTLLHKVWYGNVDLQFAGMGRRLREMREKYGSHLGDRARLVQASKPTAVRIKMHRIDMTDDLDQLEGKIMEAIRAAQYLLQWFLGLPEGKR